MIYVPWARLAASGFRPKMKYEIGTIPAELTTQLRRPLVAVGAQFGVLDGTHGECSGHEPDEPGEYEHARVDAGAGESLADSS